MNHPPPLVSIKILNPFSESEHTRVQSTSYYCKVHSRAATPRPASHRILCRLTIPFVWKVEALRCFNPRNLLWSNWLNALSSPLLRVPRQSSPISTLPSRSSNQKVATPPSASQSTVSILRTTYPDRLFHPCNIALRSKSWLKSILLIFTDPDLRPAFGFHTRTTSSATGAD